MPSRFKPFIGFLITVGFCATALLVAACSPNIFSSGNPGDAGVADMRNYRRANLACSGLTLSGSQLSVTDFRKILHCFNSTGALEPIENLVTRISDKDLAPVVDATNRFLLNNRSLLYQLEQTFYTLSDRKILDATLIQFGRLLQNDEFVSSSISLLKQGYATGRVSGGVSGDRNILLALQQLSTKITAEGVSTTLDAALTLARARAFASMQKHFRGESPGRRDLRNLTDQTLRFLQQTGDPRHVEVGLRLIEELASGRLFTALDHLTKSDPDRFDPNTLVREIPRLASVFQVTLRDDARVMDGLTSLFHYLHRPIPCLKGAKQVPDGAMHMIQQLARLETTDVSSYLKRTMPLISSVLAPFCELPPEMAVYYPTIFELAGSAAIQPVAELIKEFYEITEPRAPAAHPLAELLVSLLADTGSREAEETGGAPENTAGIKLLLPLLSELTDRGVWSDALLLASLPRKDDRAGLQAALRFAIQEMPGSDVSVYTALMDAVARATPDHLYGFVHSLQRFVESDQPLLVPALTALRQAFHVNDAHPIVDLVRGVLEDAPTHDRLFNTLFLMSEMPEFKDSVRLVSSMARDGRLKELLGAVLTIFHRFAVQGALPIHLTENEPAFVPLSRHDLAERDLGSFSLVEESSLTNDSCRKLDSRVSLGEYLGPGFDEQMGHFVSCSNVDGRHDDLADTVEFLRAHRDERRKPYIGTVFDLVWALEMTRDELKYLADAFVTAFDERRIERILDAAKMYVLTDVRAEGEPRRSSGPVLEPLLEALPVLTLPDVRPTLRRFEVFLGGILRRPELPASLRYVDDLLGVETEAPLPDAPGRYDLARIKRWVGNKECTIATPDLLEPYKEKRARQIMSDSDRAITNWDLVDGQPRRTWAFGEFREFINPLLTKFGDPKQGVRPTAAIDALLNSLRYFTLKPGQRPNAYQHYTREELRKFLVDRSDDYRLLTYFYPGENSPRVRLATTLDRLELVLINSDFWAPWPFKEGTRLPRFRNKRNFGLYFLGQLADAWGDEDERIWPKEIKEKYAGSRPPTLAQAVASMKGTMQKFERLVGLPRLNYCDQVADPTDSPDVQYAETHDPYANGKAPGWLPALHIPLMRKYLFNIHQVFPVLEENLPVPGRPLGQGGKYANGMRVLRDLFFQLAYSTPHGYMSADFTHPSSGWYNNLSVIMRLERAGFTRQITRNLRGLKSNDPEVVAFFDGFLDGAMASPDPLSTTEHPRYHVHSVLKPLLDTSDVSIPGAGSGSKAETVDEPQHDLFWKVVEQMFGVIDAAESRALDETHREELEGKTQGEVAKIRQRWSREYLGMKQMGFYAFAAAGKLGVVPSVVKTLGPILDQHSGFLTRNASYVQDLFRSEAASGFLRALYEEESLPEERAAFAKILGEALATPQAGVDAVKLLAAIMDRPQAKKAIKLFLDRREALVARPEYQALRADQVVRPVLDFFEQRGGGGSARAASDRLWIYLAERLERQDFDQILLLAARDPRGIYRALETLGHHIDDGEVPEFLRMARDAMSEPVATTGR